MAIAVRGENRPGSRVESSISIGAVVEPICAPGLEDIVPRIRAKRSASDKSGNDTQHSKGSETTFGKIVAISALLPCRIRLTRHPAERGPANLGRVREMAAVGTLIKC
jgi:hypothetical protein